MKPSQNHLKGDPDTGRLIDSLKCDLSVKESLLNYTAHVVESEKKKVTVVAKDSKAVLNSLLEDLNEVRCQSCCWEVVG